MFARSEGSSSHLARLALAAFFMTADARSQNAPLAEPIPHLTVSGTGEAIGPAARATLTVGIQTLGATAAAVGADGARLAEAVTAALRRDGLPAADLKSTHLVINPQWVYDEKTRQQRRTGFQADTTLIIDTAALDRVGTFIDAALNAGATNVSDPSFAAADDNALRHLALTRAVQNARADAEVMAGAAGGTLGPLLQISTGQIFDEPRPVMRAMVSSVAKAPPPTNIVPGDIHVSATVTGEWRYQSGPLASTR